METGNILLTIFMSLVVGVIGNLLTEPVKNWLNNSAMVSKRKRLIDLQKELLRITNLYNDKHKLYSDSIRQLVMILLFVSLGIGGGIWGTAAFVVSSPVTNPMGFSIGGSFLIMKISGLIAAYVGAAFFGISIGLSIVQIGILNKIVRFEEYKKEIEARISQLSTRVKRK